LSVASMTVGFWYESAAAIVGCSAQQRVGGQRPARASKTHQHGRTADAVPERAWRHGASELPWPALRTRRGGEVSARAAQRGSRHKTRAGAHKRRGSARARTTPEHGWRACGAEGRPSRWHKRRRPAHEGGRQKDRAPHALCPFLRSLETPEPSWMNTGPEPRTSY